MIFSSGKFTARDPAEACPPLETGRIYLRRPRAGDRKAWMDLRLQNRAFLQPFEPLWPAHNQLEASFARYLRVYGSDQADKMPANLGFLIFKQPAQTTNQPALIWNRRLELIGGISLANIRWGALEQASLNYWLGQTYCQQGYMSEALRLMITYGFHQIGLHRLEAYCLRENTASIALLRKSSFHEEGIALSYLRINGMWQDHLRFALIHPEVI